MLIFLKRYNYYYNYNIPYKHSLKITISILSLSNMNVCSLTLSIYLSVPLELHPHGTAPTGGDILSSPWRGLYPCGALSPRGTNTPRLSLPLLNLTYPKISIIKRFKFRGCNSALVQFHGYPIYLSLLLYNLSNLSVYLWLNIKYCHTSFRMNITNSF